MVDANGANQLRRGRDAFRRGAWEEAYGALTAAAQGRALESQDLDALADCAHYMGRTERCAEILYGQHADHLAAGRVEAAARAAYRLHMLFALNGQAALAAGWLGRAARALDAVPGCVAAGYVALAEAEGAYWRGELAESVDAARRARVLGEQHIDSDVTVVAVHLEGRALVRMGDVLDGLRLIDEAMAAAVAGELSPFYAVWVYCSSIITCHSRSDIRRAAEWTAAFERWSQSHEPAPFFSGACHLHRGEIKQLRGAWAEAEQENLRAVALLRGLVTMDAAQASYHLGELHRLRGDYAAAEAAFADAGDFGGDVQPGLSLLRYAQGRADAAVAGLRRALAEASRDATARARLLPAAVEIGLAYGDVATARADADQLSATATTIGTSAMQAVAAFSHGAVELAEGRAGDALGSLRRAERLWGELDVPYERARARQLIGMACRAAGDEDAATLDLRAARRVFTDLGAVPDIAVVDRQLSARPARPAPVTPGALTPREVEVLRLVATGKTNHAVASQLQLSERTVARHLSNIFTKTGVESRAAATAYAYRNRLA